MIPQRRHNQWSRGHARNDQENRSLLLQDFLKGRYPNMQLNDIVSHVCHFARDREGSKFIQTKLDDASNERKLSIFREMQPSLLSLMTDRFGNYIVQKFMEIGSNEQRHEILTLVQCNFMELSQHRYGCRIVQRAIEHTTNYYQQHAILVQFYGPNIIELAKDPHGNHVVQTCFRSALDLVQNNLFLYIHDRVIELSYHLNGCRVIQCILEHGTDTNRIQIFNQILNDPMTMIQDRYGNYVIQSAIQYCPTDLKNYLIDFVLRDVIFLSSHKYSSNVVEKCIDLATPLQQEQTMDLICSNNGRWLKRFCTDKFANYPVQKLIETVSIQKLNQLHSKIEPHFSEMERHVCGQRIIHQLKERLQQLNDVITAQFQQFSFFHE